MKSLFRRLFGKAEAPPVAKRAPSATSVRPRNTALKAREKRVAQLLEDPAMSIDQSGAGYNPYDTQSIDLADITVPVVATGKKADDADGSNPYNNTGGFDPDENWTRVK